MSSYAVPYVVERTPNGERSMDVFSRLLVERIVYLGTEIDDGVANALIAQLLHLASDGSDVPISLYVNSPGGSPGAALAVYDTPGAPPADALAAGLERAREAVDSGAARATLDRWVAGSAGSAGTA